MDPYTINLLLYIFGPPLLSLLFAAAICVDGNRRTRKLDEDIAAYRARKAEAQRQQMETLIGT